MKLTKEDFMCLPKERLAELLVEAQDQVRIETITVPIGTPPNISKPWWEQPYGPVVTYNDSTFNDNTLIAKN